MLHENLIVCIDINVRDFIFYIKVVQVFNFKCYLIYKILRYK